MLENNILLDRQNLPNHRHHHQQNYHTFLLEQVWLLLAIVPSGSGCLLEVVLLL
jgi:hypothetical protein